MKFKIVNEKLILIDSSLTIVEGENNCQAIEIEIPQAYRGIDMTHLSFRFTVTSVADPSISACQVLYADISDDKKMLLYCAVTDDFSSIIGSVVYTLTGVDSNGTVAKFISIPHEIANDISTESIPDKDAAKQLFNQTQLEVQKAVDAAERAEKASQTPAPARIYPATEEKLGGVKVDGKTITASEDGTISSVDSEILKTEIEKLKSIIGFTDSDIIGLHADFENNVFTRLGAAVGKKAGADFDTFSMYGGRKRCNVLDDGTITAYYGDNNFTEDGSNGQVMVYQPKFYYKVVPTKLDPQTNGYGYHLRSANYYISSVPKHGFKLHPAFYNEDGDPVDYILLSAYEGSIFDTSANAYLQNDEQIADFSADKLSSIAGVKPCSGKSQNLTRVNAELLAKNRGKGWHGETIKTASVNQMLMIIEFAAFDMQNAIGKGVVSISGASGENCAINTGSTSTLGNITGNMNGTEGKSPISYRGEENPWGNIWNFVYGIAAYIDKNGKLNGYICGDYNFSEEISSENYKNIGFSLADKSDFTSAFGYSFECDWLFLASETDGNSSFPVGDYFWRNSVWLDTWCNCQFGGGWNYNSQAGEFFWALHNGINIKGQNTGSRLIYVPVSKVSVP